MLDKFMGYDSEGHEIWVNYEWLRSGSVNEPYFEWLYSMFAAKNPDIQQLLRDGTQFRRFTSSVAYDDNISLEKRLELVDIEGFQRFDFREYIKQRWGM